MSRKNSKQEKKRLKKLKKFEIEQSNEIITANGGLALAGPVLADLNLDERVNHIKAGWKTTPEISNADVIRSYYGLLCLGRTAFEDIKLFKDDPFFKEALGITKVPSAAMLRQRLDAFPDELNSIIREVNTKILEKCVITPIKTECGNYIPVDVDVSPFDNSGSHKEGCTWTYKHHDGFAPIFAYIGAEGHMINSELRYGKQHCQNGTPAFIGETCKIIGNVLPKAKVLFRLDSGNDAIDNLRIFHGKYDYIIKRNPRQESLDDWLEIAKIYGVKEKPREGKTVYKGSYYRFLNLGGPELEPVRIVFEATERTVKADGQKLLIPEIEVDMYWTSLPASSEEIIRLYHDHGTSEQYHSEVKTDMDVEKLPSGKFSTNSLILQVAMVSYNVLRKIGQDLISVKEDLPTKVTVFRKRIRKVLQDIMYIACKFVHTSRTYKVKPGINSPWFRPFKRLYLAYC